MLHLKLTDSADYDLKEIQAVLLERTPVIPPANFDMGKPPAELV
jgi:hypothetical protein